MITDRVVPAPRLWPRVVAAQRLLTATLTTPWNPHEARNALAQQVRREWRQELALFEADDRPVPIRWEIARHGPARSPTGDISQVEIMDSNTLSSTHARPTDFRSGHPATVAAYFRSLPKRRLVIIGDSGTGKTTLAAQILIGLLDSKQDDEPVPVLLSLAGWNVRQHGQFRDWCAIQLGQHYPVLRTARSDTEIAYKLLDEGFILPVLDGLDEIADDSRADALRALDRFLSSDAQLMLCCRTFEYAEAVQGVDLALKFATVIKPEQLDGPEIADYLRTCLRSQPDAPWSNLLDSLRTGTAAPLASALALPIGLWLFRSVYPTVRQTDPTPIMDQRNFPDGNAVRSHLLDELIPSLIRLETQRARPKMRSRHTPLEVKAWLQYLSRNITSTDGHDIAWWRLARHSLRNVEVWVLLAAALAAAFTAIATHGFESATVFTRGIASSGGLEGLISAGVLVGFGSGIAVWLAFADSSARWLGAEIDPFERRLQDLLRHRAAGLVLGVVFGATVGLLVGLARGIALGATFGFTSGIAFGLASGASFGLAGEITFRLTNWAGQRVSASTPSSTLHADLRLCFISTLVVTLAFAVALGVAVGVAVGLANILSGALAGRRSQASAVYLLSVTKLSATRRLPFRLMQFLRDAHQLGLLRVSGPVYQFRHSALENHLRAHP